MPVYSRTKQTSTNNYGINSLRSCLTSEYYKFKIFRNTHIVLTFEKICVNDSRFDAEMETNPFQFYDEFILLMIVIIIYYEY